MTAVRLLISSEISMAVPPKQAGKLAVLKIENA